jgi:glycogen synthase
MVREERRPRQTSPAFGAGRNGRKPCVLHVLDHSWPVLSGYSIRSRNLVSAQQSLGMSLRVVTSPLHQLDDPASANTLLDDVEYLRTPISSSLAHAALRRRWPFVREYEVVRMLYLRLLEIIKSCPVDIVYAHSPALCGLAALRAARKCGLPFVYEVRAFWEDAATSNGEARRSVRYRLTRELETYVVRRADAVAAIAKPMLGDLRSRGIPANRLFHVPNGVDTQCFRPESRDAALARDLGFGEGTVFGFFGSLYGYEGVSWLIRGLAELRLRGHNSNLVIVGRGEDETDIADAIRECDAAKYVHILGHVPHQQIHRYYSVIDVAVYPRRRFRLTELVTPLKPLEAMAFGKPVLASAVGGISELVEDQRTGLLFEPENISDFCRQAERIILSPALRQSLGEAGRKFVVRERDWKIIAEKYQAIYDTVLARIGRQAAMAM